MKLSHCIAFLTLILGMTACKEKSTVEITEQRELCQFDKDETYRLNFNFLAAKQPVSWRRIHRTDMRDLNYRAGQTVEIAVLGNLKGSILDNFNRWLTEQFRLPALNSLLSCTKVEVMGKQGYMLEATGTFQNKPNQALIGMVVDRGQGQLLSIKVTGDVEEVKAEKENVMKFVSSLRNSKWKEAK